MAAIKIPHSSAAILGSKFLAGGGLLSCCSVLLHAAISGAADEREEFAVTQTLFGKGSVWRACGAAVGPVRSCSKQENCGWHSPGGSEQLPGRDRVSWASPEAFVLLLLLPLQPQLSSTMEKQPMAPAYSQCWWEKH